MNTSILTDNHKNESVDIYSIIKKHPQNKKRDSYLCSQTKLLMNTSILTDNHKNESVDIYSINALLMPNITEIVTSTKSDY